MVVFRRNIGRICMVMLVLVLISSAAALAEEVTITFFHCCGQDYRNALYSELSRAFEARYPGVKVNDVYPAAGGGGYSDNIKVAIAGGRAPDVMWLGNGLWNFADVLLPLDSLYENEPHMKEILPHIIKSHIWDGKLIGMPYGINTHAFFYNENMLAEAGVIMPKDWTWDEAISMAKKMTKDNNADGDPDQWGLALSELTQAYTFGDNFYTADLRKTTINNPGTIAGVQMYADLITGKYGVHPPSGIGASNVLMYQGKVAMAPRGVFELADYESNANFNWNVQIYPELKVGDNTYRTSWFSSETWAVYAGTKHPDIALRFVSFLMERENMIKFTNLGGIVPTQPSVARASFLQMKKPSNIQAFTDMLNWWKSGYSHPAGITLPAEHSLIMTGQLPASTGIQEIERKINDLLDAFWAKR